MMKRVPIWRVNEETGGNQVFVAEIEVESHERGGTTLDFVNCVLTDKYNHFRTLSSAVYDADAMLKDYKDRGYRLVALDTRDWKDADALVPDETDLDAPLEATPAFVDRINPLHFLNGDVKFVIRHNRDYADIQATVHDINDVDQVVDTMIQAADRLNGC